MRLFVLLGFALPAFGQQVASVNLQQAITSCGDGLTAVKRMRAEWTPKERAMNDREAAIKAERNALERESAVRHGVWPFRHAMRSAEKMRRAGAINAEARSLVHDRDDARAAFEKDRQRVLADIGGKLMPLLRTYAAEHGYSMVVDSSARDAGVLVAPHDITEEIVSLYDRTFPGER